MTDTKRKLAACLMLLSGVTHPAQMLFYGMDPEIRGPAMSGIVFFFVGLGLLTRYRVALWIAIVLPLMGGIGAVYRILVEAPTAFTYFHTAIDFIVVGLCAACVAEAPRERSQPVRFD